MYPSLLTVLASLTAAALADQHASLTAKAPTDWACAGANTGNDVILEQYNYTAADWECVPYAPPHGSNIFVTFGDPQYYSIDVYSDPHCGTFAADTLTPSQDMVNEGGTTECVYMETVGWADWQSAKISGAFMG
ncbi:MAG: hypothetical protein ALECFALPRED_004968 [Alectoria fallacina]|uniref:Uncharacterized protein n=1 Tax=Alectoria fallacina TaxID=1903189 RepID=A0A8H3IWK8_9LECA|nr:MAG: hypothetical protein ALECFALPRED_004968 [Alectoria fallacina]